MSTSAPPERTPAPAGRNGDETNCTPDPSSPRVVSQPSCLSPLPQLADLPRKASFADPALDIRTLQGGDLNEYGLNGELGDVQKASAATAARG